MARTFTKNVSNYMKMGVADLGNLANGAAFIAIMATIKASSFTGAVGDNQIVGAVINADSTGGFQLRVHNGTNPVLFAVSRSKSTDGANNQSGNTSQSTGTQYRVGVLFNFGSPNVTFYLNGSTDGGGTPTYGAATYTQGTATGADAIGTTLAAGVPTSTARQFDGDISEIGIWAGATSLSTADFAAYSDGVSPLLICPETLINYWPLDGAYSPEPDTINGKDATITGSLPAADHPAIVYPDERPRIILPAAAAALRNQYYYRHLAGSAA